MSDQDETRSVPSRDRESTPPPPWTTGDDYSSAPVPAQPPMGQPYPSGSSVQDHQGRPYQGPGQAQMVAPKSPAVAALASFFLPGLGSMLNGAVGKGLFFMIIYFFSWFGFWLLIGLFFIGVIFLPLVFIVWAWGMVDAYSGAQRWNARHGIIS